MRQHPEPRPRDDRDAVQDIVRDLAEIASHIGQLKGEANAHLRDPNYDRLHHRLENALSAVEAATLEARRRVRLNEGKVAEAQIESFEMRLNSARGIMPVAKGSQALRVRRRNGGKVVFARVSTFTGTTEEVDEAIRQVRENVLPRTEQLDGFKGAYFLVDRQNGKSLTVTLWESEEAMRASEEAANDLRSEVADALDTQMVGVERYEVALAAQE